MDDSILTFVRSIHIPSCRIQNTPQLIFLCGGALGEKRRYESARDYFHRYVKLNTPALAKRIRLAETINNWFDNDLFADLLQVEEFLADVSDLTLLFVESPGSIAELGAFAASDVLRPKTLAVINTAHGRTRSFIADGPVRRIKKADDGLVFYWEWDTKKLNSEQTLREFASMSRELVALIEARRRTTAVTPLLSPQSHGHTMLLVADLISIIGITFITELQTCLAELGFEADRALLQRYLSLLEHLELITQKLRRSQTYYMGPRRPYSPFIQLDFTPGFTGARDRARITSLIRNFLLSTDKRRADLLRQEIEDRSPRTR